LALKSLLKRVRGSSRNISERRRYLTNSTTDISKSSKVFANHGYGVPDLLLVPILANYDGFVGSSTDEAKRSKIPLWVICDEADEESIML